MGRRSSIQIYEEVQTILKMLAEEETLLEGHKITPNDVILKLLTHQHPDLVRRVTDRLAEKTKQAAKAS